MKKLIIFLLVFVSLPTFARSFDIEVIVFKRNVSPEQTNEAWPQDLKPVNVENTITFNNAEVISENNISLLPPTDFKLNEQYQALEDHAGFKPLVHVAWRQTDTDESNSPIFHIQAGENFSDRFAVDGQPVNANDQPANVNEQSVITNDQPINDATSGTSLSELDGTIQVYVQHYLYLKTNLDLRIPGKVEVILQEPVTDDMTEQDADGQEAVQIGNLEPIEPKVEVQDFLKKYRMQQKRQIRSGEIHYLDNPLLGVIIRIDKA